jgi:hypothetical protein
MAPYWLLWLWCRIYFALVRLFGCTRGRPL